MKNSDQGVVYSTEFGKMCPECARPIKECSCARAKGEVVGDGRVRVSRSTQGRSGKGVTLITGLPLKPAELKKLAKELKQRCGCGGTVKDGVIEIQGEKRDLLVEELIKRGYQAKRSGG